MKMNQQERSDRRPILAVLVVTTLMLASGLASANEFANVPGVIAVGSIEPPGYSEESGSGGYEEGPYESDTSSDSSTCIIPNPFGGGCLFEFSEHEEEQHSHYDRAAWYYHSATNDTRSGYYADVLGGVFFLRVQSGDYTHEESSGESGEGDHYDREFYDTNIGYSEEHIQQSSWFLDNDYSESESFQETSAEAGLTTDVVEGNFDVTRQEDGRSAESVSEDSSDSADSSDSYFGIPLFGEGESSSHYYEREAEAFWNQTSVNGNIYLVNQLDDSRVEIIGLSIDKGDREESGSEAGRDEQHEYTDILGFNLIGSRQIDDHQSNYWYVNEWLYVTIDAINGTVEGDLIYDHGESEESGSTYNQDRTDVLGIGFGSEGGSDYYHSEAWRRVTFALDAADGTAVAEVEHWDEDSQSDSTTEDNTIVIIPIGTTTEEHSQVHSDGTSIGFDLGNGEILWFDAVYENRTSSSSQTEDFTIDHSPLFGSGSETVDDRRGIDVNVGSGALGFEAGTMYEETHTREESNIRVGGDDLIGTFSEDEHWGTETGASFGNGLFQFNMGYTDGNSNDGVSLAGTDLGMRNDYEEFHASAGGSVEDDTGTAGTLLVYGFSHEERHDDQTIYAGDSDVLRLDQTSTTDDVTLIVLNGIASANAGREWNTYTIYAGDSEIADASTQTTEAAIAAGPASVDTSVLLIYADVGDTLGLAIAIATWCVDPGVPLPWDVVSGALTALPGEAQAVGAIALAVIPLLLCFGAPALAPVFANPCVIADLAAGVVFGLGGPVGGLLPGFVTSLALGLLPAPVAGLVPGNALDVLGVSVTDVAPVTSEALGTGLATAETGYDVARGGMDAVNGCFWATVPEEVRNPQPILAAMSLAQNPSGNPQDLIPWGISPPPAVPDPWPESVGPTVAAYWPTTGDVWTLYDQTRVTAYGMLDIVFRAESVLETPSNLPPIDPTCPDTCTIAAPYEDAYGSLTATKDNAYAYTVESSNWAVDQAIRFVVGD